jgi:hypothetical protein
MRARIIATFPFALLGAAACSQDNAPRTGPVMAIHDPGAAVAPAAQASKADVIRFTGTVEHQDAEGGAYVIRTDDGRQYRPVELPEDFRVDGLQVEVQAKRRDDVLTKDMAGQSIELLDIRKRAAG